MSSNSDSPNVQMTVKGLILDPTSKMPVVILQQESTGAVLPIWIGVCEANSIAMELEGSRAPRPMTHDLIDNLIHTLGFSVQHMTIHTLSDGVFFASIQVADEGGQRREVDARPSDALAVALRARAAIYVDHDVFDQAKVEESSADETLRTILERLRPEDLGEYEM